MRPSDTPSDLGARIGDVASEHGDGGHPSVSPSADSEWEKANEERYQTSRTANKISINRHVHLILIGLLWLIAGLYAAFLLVWALHLIWPLGISDDRLSTIESVLLSGFTGAIGVALGQVIRRFLSD